MSIVSGDARIRLAMVLAGGGRRARRFAAGLDRSVDTAILAHAGAPAAWLHQVEDRLRDGLDQILEKTAATGWRWIVPMDPEWPDRLGHISDPPLGLFVRGRLRPRPAAAIVGSRRATTYGRTTAFALAEALTRSGGLVVSGMARGVDGAAHRGALEAGGPTWAVWGAGPDRVYPAEHRQLAEAIAEQGALITEYPPGTPPRAGNFPERNRLIAGLAAVVVVVQAAGRSGAMATARLALDENRDVMAVPGNIDHELSIGPNGLLRAGAIPCTMAGDLLEAVGLEREASAAPAEAEPPVLAAIHPGEALSPDELAHRSGRSVAEVQAELFQLEVAGHIVRRADGAVERRR